MLFLSNVGERIISKEDVIGMFDPEWEKPDLRMMQDRYDSTCQNRNTIDEKIKSSLRDGWKLENLDRLLYVILLASTDEMLSHSSEAPPEIVAKEYTDLAADFFAGSEVAFVSAYLNSLRESLKK